MASEQAAEELEKLLRLAREQDNSDCADIALACGTACTRHERCGTCREMWLRHAADLGARIACGEQLPGLPLPRQEQLPPGIEWPRYADGRLIELGDRFWCNKRKYTADEITFGIDGVSVGDCPYYEGDGIKIADSWSALANDILAKTLHDEATPEDAREWADRAADLQQGVE